MISHGAVDTCSTFANDFFKYVYSIDYAIFNGQTFNHLDFKVLFFFILDNWQKFIFFYLGCFLMLYVA